jgi:hypothetical protein
VADAADDYDTDPDAENHADGNDPETAWHNQGRRDSPNGSGRLDTTGQDRQVPETGGDMRGDTYPDDAADHAYTGTAAAGTLMAELDSTPAATPDRPRYGGQRPGSPDSQRYPNGVTAADTDTTTATSKPPSPPTPPPPGSKPPAKALYPTPPPSGMPRV